MAGNNFTANDARILKETYEKEHPIAYVNNILNEIKEYASHGRDSYFLCNGKASKEIKELLESKGFKLEEKKEIGGFLNLFTEINTYIVW